MDLSSFAFVKASATAGGVPTGTSTSSSSPLEKIPLESSFLLEEDEVVVEEEDDDDYDDDDEVGEDV